MWNPFKSFFKKKSQSVLGIDIGATSIKVVQLGKKKGKAVLETYGELALGPYEGKAIGMPVNLQKDILAAALQDIIREAHVTTKSCGLAISYSSSLITLIEMPAVHQNELAQIIPLEARKYIPVPISDVTLDWWVVPKEQKAPDLVGNEKKAPVEKIDVLLVAINNETLNRYQNLINSVVLDATFFEIEAFSTLRATLEQDLTSHMIIDVGALTTKVYITERGLIQSSHSIDRGAQSATVNISQVLGITFESAEALKRNMKFAPEEHHKEILDVITLTLDYIFSEANRVLLSYQKKFNKNVTRVIIVGGGARLDHALDIAKAHLKSEVVLGDPFDKIETPTFLEGVLKETGPEFATAIGIALRKLQEM